MLELSVICKYEANTKLEKMRMLDEQTAGGGARAAMSVSVGFTSSTMPPNLWQEKGLRSSS